MCGISGAISLRPHGLASGDVYVWQSMMMMTTVRGVDGTGWFSRVPTDGKDAAIYVKSPDPATLVVLDQNRLRTTVAQRQFVVGHCRAATVGTVRKETAHPFSHGAVIGVHNGTLRSPAWSLKEWIGNYKFVSDSDALYKALSLVDPDEAVEVLGRDMGSYSLVWYDSRICALRFARNSARPMTFFKEADHTWWFSSEGGILAAALARRRGETSPLDHTAIAPWQSKLNTLLTIPLNEPENASVVPIPRTYSHTYKPPAVYEAPAPAPSPSTRKETTKGAHDPINYMRVLSVAGDMKPCGHPSDHWLTEIGNSLWNFLGQRALGKSAAETGEVLAEAFENCMWVTACVRVGSQNKTCLAFGFVANAKGEYQHALAEISDNFWDAWAKRRTMEVYAKKFDNDRSLGLFDFTGKRVIAYSDGGLVLAGTITNDTISDDDLCKASEIFESDDLPSKFKSVAHHPHWSSLFRQPNAAPLPWRMGWDDIPF